MLDVICIGTVTIDLYFKGDTLTENNDRFELAVGGKYFTEHFYEGLGGGGANVAIGIRKLGMESGLIAKIGNNPFKPVICNKLDESDVRYKDLCQFEDGYTNISSVLLSKTGEKTIVNYRSPHQHIIESADDYKLLTKGTAVYMANLSQVPLKERIAMLKHAKEYHRKTYANLNVTDCRRPIVEIAHFLEHVDVFIINTHEFADIVKTEYESIDFQANIMEKFEPFHEGQLVVLTDGKKGSYAYYQGKTFHVPAVKHVEVVDTTGAGDAFTAGFISEYQKTHDIKKSMQKGVEYSVTIIKKLGSN